jgi:hypothetical protein
MQKNQHIVVKEGTTKICEDAFSNYSLLESVFIPSSVTEIERYAFYNCYSLQSIDIDKNNLNYASINGVLYDKNITTIIFCPAAKKKITIPNSVTSIGVEAFSYCSALSSINVDKNNLNYTDIKDVLYDKNKTTLILCPKDQKKITIPSSVTSIEDNAFTNCTSLTSITIQTENPPIVHQNAFTKVPTSVTIKVPKGSIEKYKTANIWDSFTNYEEF